MCVTDLAIDCADPMRHNADTSSTERPDANLPCSAQPSLSSASTSKNVEVLAVEQRK